MIPKPQKDSYKEISSWRPIALLDCIYKLFTATITYQINEWTIRNDLNFPLQKGNGKYEGCSEHNLLLRCLMEDQKISPKQELHICFLDIADAFGTITINHILETLRRMGMREASRNIIYQLYKDCSSYYICGKVTTKSIPIKKGVRQGCPLSMLLFNIGITPILTNCDSVIDGGVTICGNKVACLAYADDIALIANNQISLQRMIEKASKTAGWMGIDFRASKCGYLPIPDKGKKQVQMAGEIIPRITTNSYKYLGVNLSRNLKESPEILLKSIQDDLIKIETSILFPWQKIEAYMMFLHSRLIFAFRNFNIRNRELDNYGHHEKENTVIKKGLDHFIRKNIKKILNVPKTTCNAYLYTAKDNGGIGLIATRDEYAIQSIIHSFRSLNCDDKIVNDTARYSLATNAAIYSNNSNPVTLEKAIEWLNEGSRENAHPTWWTKTRNSIKHLAGDKTNLKISFKYNELGICLQIISNDTNILISPTDKGSLSELIHRTYHSAQFKIWTTQAKAGLCAMALNECKVSNTIIFNGGISIYDWEFIHQARTTNLPVNKRPGRINTRCRKCGEPDETQAHVLCHCNINMKLVTGRHNAILYMVEKALKHETTHKITMDRPCELSNTKARVDLQIEIGHSRQFYLIDIKTPYDSISNLESAITRNEEKYSELRDEIKQKIKNWSITIGTIVVGCLGSWLQQNDIVLRKLGLSQNAISNIKKDAIASNIRWSNNTWNHHNQMHFNDKDLNFEEINQQYTQNEAERLLATKETTRKKKAKKD